MSEADYTIWKDKNIALNFLSGMRKAIPYADDQILIMLRLISELNIDVETVLDIGAGDGVLGRSIYSVHPKAEINFLDISEDMLNAAKKASTECKSAKYILSDYGEVGWGESLPHKEYDVIVSGFSIHHQTDERKKSLYKEIYDLVKPGGIFINVEHVSSAGKWVERAHENFFIDSICDYRKSTGNEVDREKVANEYLNRIDGSANILASAEDQICWLRKCGFREADIFFKSFELAVFGGIK